METCACHQHLVTWYAQVNPKPSSGKVPGVSTKSEIGGWIMVSYVCAEVSLTTASSCLRLPFWGQKLIQKGACVILL